jgi:hypothetical protein
MVPLVEPIDMAVHWKALEEHFLMVPLVEPIDMTIHWKALESS